MEEFKNVIPHSLVIEDRKKLTLTGITDVGNFDEESICVYTSSGEILIKGEKLQVNVLDVKTGQFQAEGKIISLQYSDKRAKNQSLFSRVFR